MKEDAFLGKVFPFTSSYVPNAYLQTEHKQNNTTSAENNFWTKGKNPTEHHSGKRKQAEEKRAEENEEKNK